MRAEMGPVIDGGADNRSASSASRADFRRSRAGGHDSPERVRVRSQ